MPKSRPRDTDRFAQQQPAPAPRDYEPFSFRFEPSPAPTPEQLAAILTSVMPTLDPSTIPRRLSDTTRRELAMMFLVAPTLAPKFWGWMLGHARRKNRATAAKRDSSRKSWAARVEHLLRVCPEVRLTLRQPGWEERAFAAYNSSNPPEHLSMRAFQRVLEQGREQGQIPVLKVKKAPRSR